MTWKHVTIMKIGYFAHSKVGVSETFISDLMIALNQRAQNFSFFSGASTGTPVQGIPTHYTGYYDTPSRSSYLVYKVGQILGGRGDRLKFRYAQRSAVQILHRYKKHLTDIDVAFVDYGTSSALLYPVLNAYQIPYVIRVLGYDVTGSFSSKAYKKAFLESCRHAVAITAVSAHLKRLLVLAGVDPAKVHVINLGTDGHRNTPVSWDIKKSQKASVVHLGRLTPKKHPLALIHAFSLVQEQVEDAQLTIIGDGPLMGEAKQRVKKLGLEKNVVFTGALDRNEAIPILNQHWVFAQHSVTSMTGDQEGFPVSPAEAASLALPVVATAHSGLTEQILHGETGFLVQEHHYDEMAEHIIHLLKHPELAERMGEAGRRRILEICNLDIQTKKVYDLLEAAYAKNQLAYADN